MAYSSDLGAIASPLVRKLVLQTKAAQAARGVVPRPAPTALPLAINIFRPQPTPAPVSALTPTPVAAPVMSVAPVQAPAPVIVSGPSGVTAPQEMQIAEEDVGVTPAFDFQRSPLPLIIIGLGALFLFSRKGR